MAISALFQMADAISPTIQIDTYKKNTANMLSNNFEFGQSQENSFLLINTGIELKWNSIAGL